MTPDTDRFLKKLKELRLFRNVGQPTALVPSPSIHDWHSASTLCSSAEWNYIQTDTSNILRSHIASVDMKAFRKWNKVVQSMYPFYQDWVIRTVGELLPGLESVQSVIGSAKWDILFVCLEHEYSSCNPPSFYQTLSAIYLDGHFPCGWEGKYPSEGKLLIY